jgi:hypothetical protein
MLLSDFYEVLWNKYIELTTQVGRIHDLFQALGEDVVNDHIALRTFEGDLLGIEVLETYFLEQGYEVAGDYVFAEKKLRACHYELEGFPRVFISELRVSEFSSTLQDLVNSLLSQMTQVDNVAHLLLGGRPWEPVLWREYELLRQESEYAAWMAAFGFRANHFTISVNNLKILNDLEDVNHLLEQNSFILNNSGGLIKGSPEALLEQSSTLAECVKVDFADGEYVIPTCYYEFAKRYRDEEGELFSGFIQSSADKIFESTDWQD